MHFFRTHLNAVAIKYSDASRNEAQGRDGEQSDIELSGAQIAMAGAYNEYELALELRSLTPKSTDYWVSRSEIFLSFLYYWPEFPYIQPIFGYWQLKQSGDRDHADAPPAFLDKNNSIYFGLHTSWIPWAYAGQHGILIRGHYRYLSTLERKSNFGNDGQAMLGYVYIEGPMKIALAGGTIQNFYNATVEDEDNEGDFRHVRHKYTGTVYGLYFQY